MPCAVELEDLRIRTLVKDFLLGDAGQALPAVSSPVDFAPEGFPLLRSPCCWPSAVRKAA